MNVLLVMLGGIVGAVARVVVDSVLTHRFRPRWPLGTFTINVTGSLVLGLVTGLSLTHGLPAHARLLVGVGFCGAYTTFSTAAFEVVGLARHRPGVIASAYAVGGCLASLAAAALGLVVTGGW